MEGRGQIAHRKRVRRVAGWGWSLGEGTHSTGGRRSRMPIKVVVKLQAKPGARAVLKSLLEGISATILDD